jgi:hypothetical protein
LGKYSESAVLKIAGKKWSDFIAKRTANLAKIQTAKVLSQQYDRMGLCSHFGSEFDPQNEMHIQELLVAFSVVVLNYREILANNSARQ